MYQRQQNILYPKGAKFCEKKILEAYNGGKVSNL